MTENEQPTIEQGLKKCVSPLRVILLIIVAVSLWRGVDLQDAGSRESAPVAPLPPVAAGQSTPSVTSPPFLAIAKDGVLRVNGTWDRHPFLAGLGYSGLHQVVVTFVMGLIILGKRREPSRAQMTAGHLAGLTTGFVVWTLYWGYSQWWWYVLVFIAQNFFLSTVVQYTANWGVSPRKAMRQEL